MSFLGLSVANLAATCAYAGFQWTVHLTVYRQFPVVEGDRFAHYEAEHQRCVTPLVGVLFGGLIVTDALLLLTRPAGLRLVGSAAAAVLLVALLAVTAFLAVPEHRRLGNGFELLAYQRLLRADLLRVVVATADVGVAAVLVLAG